MTGWNEKQPQRGRPGTTRALAVVLGAALLACAAPSASQAQPQAEQWAIFVMRPDGSEVRRLAKVDGYDDHTWPRWSHDGKRVVFEARSLANRERAFFVVNADGSGLRKLGVGTHPNWSPDDKQIAYNTISTSGPEVYVQNVDGEGTELLGSGECAEWSPDGSQLAISDRVNVRLVDLISGDERQLLETAVPLVFRGPSWSPDGKRLAVVVRAAESQARRLLLVDPAGGPDAVRLRLKGGMGGTLGFSPDGKKLVFSDGYKVRIVTLDAKDDARIVPRQVGKAKNPDWSPDGQWIVFSSDREMP